MPGSIFRSGFGGHGQLISGRWSWPILKILIGELEKMMAITQFVLPYVLLCLEDLVIFDQGFDVIFCKQGQIVSVKGFLIVVGDDVIDDFFQAWGIRENFGPVDILYLDIDKSISPLAVLPHVFDTEAQHVLVANGIGDYIFVQAIPKKLLVVRFPKSFMEALSEKWAFVKLTDGSY